MEVRKIAFDFVQPSVLLSCSMQPPLIAYYFVSFLVETLSMKGLTLNCMDRKSEAYELVRRGLKVLNHNRFSPNFVL